jgi:DNA-binding Xre family transcriptional regulator
MSNIHRGSSFEDFLIEAGILEEVNELAARQIIAWRLKDQMETNNISKSELARRMKTSRSQVDRILEGEDPGIRLDTLERAAKAVGCELRVELLPEKSASVSA